MISRKFVNIGFESRDLAMLHDACIQIHEVRGSQNRLRAQGSPQFINGGAGQLKLALPCRLPVACIHVKISVCPARPGCARRTANAHSSRVLPSNGTSRTHANTMPDLRCPAISSMTSEGISVALAVSLRPIINTSGISLPSASPVLAERARASMVMDSISFTNRCLSLPEVVVHIHTCCGYRKSPPSFLEGDFL